MNLSDASDYDLFSATIDGEYTADEIKYAADKLGIPEDRILLAKAGVAIIGLLEEEHDSLPRIKAIPGTDGPALMIKLTPLELRALKRIDNYLKWADPKQIGFGFGLDTDDTLRKSYRVWNRLNELGLIDRSEHDEQVRGEKRVFWFEYRQNRNGRAYLESLKSTE